MILRDVINQDSRLEDKDKAMKLVLKDKDQHND